MHPEHARCGWGEGAQLRSQVFVVWLGDVGRDEGGTWGLTNVLVFYCLRSGRTGAVTVHSDEGLVGVLRGKLHDAN